MNLYGRRAAVVIGVGALGLSMAGFLAPTAAADTTLVLFEHDTEQNFVDHGEPGPGPGDQFIFAGDVFDRPGGLFLGRATGNCTTLSGDETAGQSTCNVTFNLDGGQIGVQGLFDNAALFVRGDTNPLYITGGTGIYRTARGDGTIQVPVEVPDQTDANVVLDVVTT
jgi:allene oxide cyclase-like protein